MLKASQRALGHSESKKSKIEEKVEKLERFFAEKQAWEERNGRSRWLEASGQGNGVAYEQMTLPGIDKSELSEKDEKEPGYAGYVFEKGSSAHSVAKLLCGLNSKEAEDCAKYLQIPKRKNCGRDCLAEMIAETYHEHPEYLLYILDEEEDYCTLLDLARMADEPVQKDLPLQSLAYAVTLGLVDIRIRHLPGKRGGKAVVSLATDAQILLEALGKTWKKELRNISCLEEHVKCCVLQYGLLEMDAFFDIYRNYWPDFAEKEDFFRFVYWHCGMNGLVQTVTHSETGVSYVCINKLDLEAVFRAQEKYAGDYDYRLPEKEEILQLGENIADRYVEWDVFGDILTYGYELEPEEIDHLISGLYFSVVSGISATRLIKMVLPVVCPVTLDDYVELWLYVMGVCMETDLTILKGYSRNDFSELAGVSAGDIQLFEESKLKKNVDLKTHLWELPARFQVQLYNLYGRVERKSRKPEVLAFLKEIGCNNPEICWLFANHFFMEGEYDNAEEMLGRIRKRDQDESVKFLKQQIGEARELDGWDSVEDVFGIPDTDFPFWEDGFTMPAQPYRRETPKIGRNDPCPCGSGKKYKKCCGK